MSISIEAIEIAREISAASVPPDVQVEERLCGLQEALVRFDEQLGRLQPDERRAVVSVLSNRISDALLGAESYVEQRLKERQ
jgi:hypothetical protein